MASVSAPGARGSWSSSSSRSRLAIITLDYRGARPARSQALGRTAQDGDGAAAGGRHHRDPADRRLLHRRSRTCPRSPRRTGGSRTSSPTRSTAVAARRAGAELDEPRGPARPAADARIPAADPGRRHRRTACRTSSGRVTINRGSNDGIEPSTCRWSPGRRSRRDSSARVIDVTPSLGRGAAHHRPRARRWPASSTRLGETGLVWGQGDEDLRMDLDRLRRSRSTGDENVFTQGYEVERPAGALPAGPPDRTGLACLA